MRVVSNTSPLSNLAIIGRLPLVWEQFGAVIIPEAVSTELARRAYPHALDALSEARGNSLLTTVSIRESAAADLLSAQLDRGEAEAIALATQVKADWLLIDERAGRLIARRTGLRITGVLGILIRAKTHGRLALVKPELEALRSEARFFVGNNLEREVLAAVGE
jgi:predicted nucleic acid-binding protein